VDDLQRKMLATQEWACCSAPEDLLRAEHHLALQKRVGAWGDATFGAAQTVPGILAHLRRELAELTDAATPENVREEAADVLILLLGLAHQSGFDLLQEGERKLAINQARTWAPPDAEGVISHVQEGKP
jgi:NTP pyrophosphatase (non-canonical NTP hydrolase)